MRRHSHRLAFLAAVSSIALTASAAFAAPGGPTPDKSVPAARTYDFAKQRPVSAKKLSTYCDKHKGNCRFKVDRAGSSEYFTAVKSLGNAVVNCTKHDITVTRQVSFRVSSSDNLGGEITGQLSVEGQLNANGSVTAGVSGEAGGTFKSPDQSKGPSTEVTAKGGANGSGTIGASASLKAAFEGGFKLSYAKNWATEQTESTSYEVTVADGDALSFGGSAAMQRVAGSITTGGGLGAHHVLVDGPSSVNHSTFLASTHTVPGNTCQRLRPTGTGPEDTTQPTSPQPAPGPGRAARAARIAVPQDLVELPDGLPAGSRLKSRLVLHGERS